MSDRPFVSDIVMECPKCGQRAEFSREYLPPYVVYSGYVDGSTQGPCIIRQCEFCRYTFSHQTKDGEGSCQTRQPRVPGTESPAAQSPYPRRMLGRRVVQG